MTAPAAQPTLAAPGGREPIPPSTGGAPPGAPPEGPPFQSALEAERARTAIAEGQQQSHSQSPSLTAAEGAGPNTANGPHRTHRDTVAQSGTAQSVIAQVATTQVATTQVATTQGVTTQVATAQGQTLPGDVVNGSAGSASLGRTAGPSGTPASGDASTSAGTLPAANSGASITGPAPTDAGALSEAPSYPSATGGLASSAADAPTTGRGATPSGDAVATGPIPTDSKSVAPAAAVAPSPAAMSTAEGVLTGTPPELGPARTPAPAGGLPPTPPRDVTHQGAASAPPSSSSGAGVALGSPASSGEAGGSGGWGSQTGTHQPAGRGSLGQAPSASVHDKLWVPDPAQTSTGVATSGQTSTDVGTGGAGGLAEGAFASASAPGGAPEAPLLGYGVGLQQAIESLHGSIELAARQGLSQARIALAPEERGEIRIHLTQTAQGLIARVTAETPAAAQALAAAHAELRQSLSSLGLNLTRLDIGRHGHSAQGAGTAPGGSGHEGAAGNGEASLRGGRSGQTTTTAAPTDPAASPQIEEDVQLAPAPLHGTLVDVLA